jgi:hypothetical protein
MKKNILILVVISLLFISLSVSAQSSLLFDKEQFQSKFNQQTPGLNTEFQNDFQQIIQNKKQQALKSSQQIPDMSIGRGFTQGLEAPGMDRVNGSMFNGFHFREKNITPDKFKKDFSSTFVNQQQQNIQYGQNGMSKAQNFDNSIPKSELQNQFSDLKNNNNNAFGNFKNDNSRDMKEGLDEFKNNFANFQDKRNSDMKSIQEKYDKNYNLNKTEIDKPGRFENPNFENAPTIDYSKNSGNPYVGGGSRSSKVEIGKTPDSPLYDFTKSIGNKADDLTSGLFGYFGWNKNTNPGQTQPTIKDATKNQISQQFPRLYKRLDTGVNKIKNKID